MEATFQVEGSQHIQISRQEAAWKDRQLPRDWFQAEVELNKTAKAGGACKGPQGLSQEEWQTLFCVSFIYWIYPFDIDFCKIYKMSKICAECFGGYKNR